jgi:hypothetical protein
LLQHGDGIGRRGKKAGLCAKEFAEENLGVGERAARGGVGGDGADPFEGTNLAPVSNLPLPGWLLNDELNGADFV